MAAVEGLITLKADTAQVRKATTDLSNFNKGAINASTSAQNLGKNVIDARIERANKAQVEVQTGSKRVRVTGEIA